MTLRTLRLGCATAALVLAGCTGVPVHIENAVPPDVVRAEAREVEGDAWGLQFVLFIPIGVNSRHARAWEQVLEEARGGWVTNVRIREGWRYAFVGTLYHTTFRATVYPRKPASAVGAAVGANVESSATH